MKAPTVMILTMGILLCFWQGALSHPKASKAALEAAEVWLALVDTEKYEASWDEAASYFQGAVSTEQWLSSMQSVRKPLGQKLSRSLKSQKYHTSLPGAPDGEYVVIQFNTSFEHKLSAVETVTPMNDRDAPLPVSILHQITICNRDGNLPAVSFCLMQDRSMRINVKCPQSTQEGEFKNE